MADQLAQLEQRVQRDLAYLCYPPSNWIPATSHPETTRVYDVIVVGAGMCGLVTGFALLNAGINNIAIFDRSSAGQEGPWVTYARMETLRSPKHLAGPAYGMASLTFRAWYEARFGPAAWQELGKIPRAMWMDYLRWYRKILKLPVSNEVEVEKILPQDGLLRLQLGGRGAQQSFILTRKVIMATGRDGMGKANIPDFVENLSQDLWAHSSAAIDFSALRDKRVIVIGVGSSAVDNAAEALEAGASEVRLLSRRKTMPRINKMMGIGSFGFSAGFPQLSDAWRWRFMHYAGFTQTPSPRNSTLRVSRHDNAFFHFNAGIHELRQADNEVIVDTHSGRRFHTDFVILGTGFTIATEARREFSGYADKLLLWRDHYSPPADLRDDELGKFPYLAPDFSLQERSPGTAPWLRAIYCFNYGANVSLGKISGDIPAISEGAQWLVQAIAADFYTTDIEQQWQLLLDYDKPELLGDEWTEAD